MMLAAVDRPPFFPDPFVGWSFFLVLMGFALVAAWWDFRTRAIPKWIPVSLLVIGVVFQMVRGGWLGAIGAEVWVLGAEGSVVGVFDGLLFAAAGFALGFAVFFAMWILRICGGGDVKLFAAIGAWIGPAWALWVLMGSTVVLIVQSVGWMMATALIRGPAAATRHTKAASTPATQRGMTYSLPLAVALALMMLWFWRFDLRLATRMNPASQTANRINRGG